MSEEPKKCVRLILENQTEREALAKQIEALGVTVLQFQSHKANYENLLDMNSVKDG